MRRAGGFSAGRIGLHISPPKTGFFFLVFFKGEGAFVCVLPGRSLEKI